ncbi:nuclear transport factor 2 family protein [Nocardia pseudovaccinii]|uniref:nuclear transport factor 2 family protein n=1 Tax=Nocardia pseudovaccinii TaxID=189540 RepID=UPI0007A45BB7|nr:nuclear transport factor 2 family protein [Nocardia pseudovaccinii]
MSATDNIAVVRRMYESKAAPDVLAEVIDPDILWDITPGFPGGGVYHGFESVGRDFFGPLFEQVDALYPVGEKYYADDADHVFALGHYHCVTKKGQTADIRFIHIWTVRDGKLAELRQAADSLVLDRALNA